MVTDWKEIRDGYSRRKTHFVFDVFAAVESSSSTSKRGRCRRLRSRTTGTTSTRKSGRILAPLLGATRVEFCSCVYLIIDVRKKSDDDDV
jgi:hypothetical protein